jgi:hypothetical protein
MRQTSSVAFWIASPILGSKPYPTFTIDAAFFNTPKAFITGGGNLSVGPPISKFCRDLTITQCQKSSTSGILAHVPLCLCAPVAISRNLQLAEGIPLRTELLAGLS